MRRALSLILLAGCGVRAAPYRFAGPLVSAVRLDDAAGLRDARLPAGPRPTATEPEAPDLAGPYAATTAPVEARDSMTLEDVRDPEDLRALTGHRDDRDDLIFALGAFAQLGGQAVEADPAVVAAAAGPVPGTIHPGDLLIFDAPEPVYAIAIARDARGVYEMIYLAHGVIRRGFVDPARPHTKRDADGRVVNTYLRHGNHEPPKGTKYLAGELLAHVLAR